MKNMTITSAMASNAAFNRIFDRLTKLSARVADRWTQIEPDHVASRRARLEEIRGRLKGEPSPAVAVEVEVGSFGALRDALGALEAPLDEVVSEAAALAEDAVELVGTMPGFFAVMTKEEKRAALKSVLARPELQSRLVPPSAAQDGGDTQHCKAILSLEIVECILGLILALAVDVAAALIAGELSPVVIAAVAIVELLMFAIAIAIAVLSYQDCIG